MNVNALIDALVRQTTILIAHLATSAGVRAPLAHVVNEVFRELALELRAQGVGGKVIADMFGMALRTYQAKMRRLSESATDRGRTLWEAVLAHIQEQELVSRGAVLHRFRRDDDATVRGVLNDLVETGMVFRSGRGDRTMYRAADLEVSELTDEERAESDAAMLLVAVNRYQPATRDELATAVKLGGDLDLALQRLAAAGRVVQVDRDGEPAWRCDECVVRYEAPVGWEAAVFDHYQALVTALCTKLRAGDTRARREDAVGGSTYGFDVWPGHPMEEEVMGQLRNMREQASELRERLEAYNADVGLPNETQRVVFYLGQTVLEDDQILGGFDS